MSHVRSVRSFRKVFSLPKAHKVQWYPGHMQKGSSQIISSLRNIDCLIEIHDARIPFSGRNPLFENIGHVKPKILILNKADLATFHNRNNLLEKLTESGVDKVLFSNCLREGSKFIKNELPTSIMEVIHSRPRYNRQENPEYDVIVIGVPNVGKSTFINLMKRTHTTLKKKSVIVGPAAGVTLGMSGRVRVSFEPDIFLKDTPGILTPRIDDVETGMKLALCGCLPDHLVGEEFIVDYMLYWMNKHECFQYVNYFSLEEPTENVLGFLSLIAKRQQFVNKLKSPSSKETIYKPDFKRAARHVLKMFRTGKLGKYMLDQDVIESAPKK